MGFTLLLVETGYAENGLAHQASIEWILLIISTQEVHRPLLGDWANGVLLTLTRGQKRCYSGCTLSSTALNHECQG